MSSRSVFLVCSGLLLLNATAGSSPAAAMQRRHVKPDTQVFDRVMAALGPDAEVRMLDFWIYVWDEVDYETKAVISVADVVWATIARAWSEANPMQQRAMLAQFAGVVEEVWGGIKQQTVSYLAGYSSAAEYATGGGGYDGSVGGSLDVIVDYAQAEGSYVINDGSGDIVYPTCCS